MNLHDSERISGLLEADGYSRAEDESDADVVVFNTCCIRENADNRLYGNLGALAPEKRSRPGMQIAVAGCLAQKDAASIVSKAPHVDVVFGTHNVADAAELLRAQRKMDSALVDVRDAPVRNSHKSDDIITEWPHVAARDRDHSAWVTIATGCDNSCTFCIVPSVRGPERSRLASDILDEVRVLAESGVREVTLLGQNVNSYGRNLSGNGRRPLFAQLLRDVAAVSGIERVRFTSPHPKDFGPETISAMAETPEVMPQLHLPVQSGSDRILAAMHRGYNADRYLQRVTAARNAIPDLALSTDIIVGFPGESDEDFDATMEVVEAARFDDAFTFIYSPRPGTAAAASSGHVEPGVARQRYARLSDLINRLSLASNRSRIGMTEELLIEGTSKKDPTMLTGRTRQGKLVHVPAIASARAGSLLLAVITDAAPHHLWGKPIGQHEAHQS